MDMTYQYHLINKRPWFMNTREMLFLMNGSFISPSIPNNRQREGETEKDGESEEKIQTDRLP